MGYKLNNVQKVELSDKRRKEMTEQVQPPVSDASMERLAQIMNDSPSVAKLAGTEWEIRALHPAVQWQIAEVACKIHNVEKATFGDVLDGLAQNFPSVVKIITLALLNDKERIKKEYDRVYETIMWESEQHEWTTLLYDILNMLDVSFFFATTNAVQIFRDLSLARKKTTEEQHTTSLVQNGGR